MSEQISLSTDSPESLSSSAVNSNAGLYRDASEIAQGRKAPLYKILIVAVVVIAAFYLKWLMDRPASAPQPMPFATIQQRYMSAANKTKTQVEEVLGSPDQDQTREPEFEFWEFAVERRHDEYPKGDGCWLKWTDPDNKNKWVAVYFKGEKSVWVIKKGF